MAHRRIEPLKKVLAMDPNDEVAWFGLGKAYMEDANFAEAITALESCIRVKPTYSAAYLALAQSLQKSGRIERCASIVVGGDVHEEIEDVRPELGVHALRDVMPERGMRAVGAVDRRSSERGPQERIRIGRAVGAEEVLRMRVMHGGVGGRRVRTGCRARTGRRIGLRGGRGGRAR